MWGGGGGGGAGAEEGEEEEEGPVLVAGSMRPRRDAGRALATCGPGRVVVVVLEEVVAVPEGRDERAELVLVGWGGG